MQADICAVCLLLEQTEVRERVVGYYAIDPTRWSAGAGGGKVIVAQWSSPSAVAA